MPLVDTLLAAIAKADADALVMHVGERPYVIASQGPIELSSRGLNLHAMVGMLNQLLPAEALRTLAEFGAVEHELAPAGTTGRDRFTVVAARGGDDIWIEVRRYRPDAPGRAARLAADDPSPSPAPAYLADAPHDAAGPADEALATGAPLSPGRATSLPPPAPPVTTEESAPSGGAAETRPGADARARLVEPSASAAAPGPRPPAPPGEVPRPAPREADASGGEGSPAVVVPLRHAPRAEPAPTAAARPAGPLERLLRLAAARGASALYLTTQLPPALRVDGEIHILGGEPPLAAGDVEAAVIEMLPDGAADRGRRAEGAEWIRDLPDLGRVRCTTFRDYRGPGLLLRMISARAASAEQLGLSREIQALATEPEGLVIVTGPRGSGKSTLTAALVDLINRQRADYVVTLERQIRLVHESRQSLISQREVRGHGDEVAAAARAALRENPDALVIEDLRTADTLQAALDAAGAGLLVVASLTAPGTAAAVERLVDLAPADRRGPTQAVLAETLRGVVAQVLLRKTAGGRLAARELLLNTPAVAALIAEGRFAQLPRAIDSGRRAGMFPLNDALVAAVQAGAVDVREAYRKAADRQGLLAQLRRDGIDTVLVERLA